MDELKILYKELRDRSKHLERMKKSKATDGKILENNLTILRVQQMLLDRIKKKVSKVDYSKVSNNKEVIRLLEQRLEIEEKIKDIDDMALINYEIEAFKLD
jgi:hypothetical protein